MGGEGAPWIGMEPFVNRPHIFQNIGDGTLFHSGSLAIEACVAAKVNITYKILYNGHVAMTGGQAAMGALPIPELTRKLQAEGVRKTVVLAENVEQYTDLSVFASNAELRSRDELPQSCERLEWCMPYGQIVAGYLLEAAIRISAPHDTHLSRQLTKREEECLAACTGAPMMMIDHHYHEHLTPESVEKLLDDLK